MAEASQSADLLAGAFDGAGGSGRDLRSWAADARRRGLERVGSPRGEALGSSTPHTPRPTPPLPLPQLTRDPEAFGRVSAANDRTTHASLTSQANEIEALKRSQAELAQKLDALQQQTDRMLVGLFDGISGLERRVETVTARSQALATQTSAARSLAARQGEELRALSVATQLDKISAVVNTVQSAAYGRSGDPLAFNNVALAANQLFWSFLEPFLKRFGLVSGPAQTVVTWLAPLGTLLTGELAMANRQHVRFLSGVSTLDGDRVVEPLQRLVADGFRDQLERRRDFPVTVTPVAPTTGIFRGEVRDGVLRVFRVGDGAVGGVPVLPAARVAWMIDLGSDIG